MPRRLGLVLPVLGPNGLIYFVPLNADNVGIFNPVSSSFSTLDIFKTIFADYKYIGGVLGPNGLIYCVPSWVDNIGIFDLPLQLFPHLPHDLFRLYPSEEDC